MSDPTVALPAGSAVYRLLLVDDEPNIIAALQRELRGKPYTITSFTDPLRAQEALAKEEFALAISDNLMPNLTGLELLAQLKAVRPLTRRILLTGRTDVNHAVAAFNDGTIHRFVSKPWDKNELSAIIHKELEIFRAEKDALNSRIQLEEQHRMRTTRLLGTLDELKQTQTQLNLQEDSTSLERVNVPQKLPGLTLLIVDKHEGVRELMIKTLKQVGIVKCHGVANGIKALEHLKAARQVDVILSEWALEGMDGLAFLNQVRASDTASARALFILMAGHEHRMMVDIALKAGVDGYLIKPFRLQTLLTQIEKLREQKETGELVGIERLKPMVFLLASGHLASRDQIQLFLSLDGIKNCLTAASGEAALLLMTQKSVDVLICDTSTKNPDWPEILKSLKTLPSPPVCLLTSMTPAPEAVVQVRRERVTDFLPGPFRQAELLAAILKAIAAQKSAPAGAPQGTHAS